MKVGWSWCCIAVAVGAPLCGAVRAPAESNNGDIDSVCHKVIETSRYFYYTVQQVATSRTQLLGYPDRPVSADLR